MEDFKNVKIPEGLLDVPENEYEAYLKRRTGSEYDQKLTDNYDRRREALKMYLDMKEGKYKPQEEIKPNPSQVIQNIQKYKNGIGEEPSEDIIDESVNPVPQYKDNDLERKLEALTNIVGKLNKE